MSIFNNLFLSRWDTAGDIQSLEAYKADYSDVKELRRKFKLGAAHDKKQDKEIADIKDMILELYSFQLAMVEYLEKDHAFDREVFQEILDNLDQATDNE